MRNQSIYPDGFEIFNAPLVPLYYFTLDFVPEELNNAVLLN